MMRKIFYIILLGFSALMLSSCGGSKKPSGMRQFEKHSRKYPVDENGVHVPTRNSDSKKVRQAMARQQKREAEEKKEAEKVYRDGITRHRSLQSPETLERMDQHSKETEIKYGIRKEFFLVRWFRPKDDVKKIEDRRDKEVKKRMAANRKTAGKNNEARMASSFQGNERQSTRPQPGDIQHGGGGTYQGGSATRYVNPSDIQMGGGGTYVSGKSNSRVKPSDIQQGGGGSYQEGKTKKQVKKASSATANTKSASPRNSPFSKRSKPKPG